MRCRRTLVFVVTLVLMCAAARLASAERLFRAGLSVQVHFLAADYGDQRTKGQAVILRGEPLEIDLGVVNPYDGPRAAAEVDWLAAVSLTLRPGGLFDPQPPPPGRVLRCENRIVLRVRGMQRVEDHVILDKGGYQIVRCRPNLAGYQLAAGRYTLTAEWSERADLWRFLDPFRPRPHPETIELELRDVVSAGDELDLYNHLAFRAFHDRQNLDEALELIELVLARHPASTAALGLRGQVRAARGASDCARVQVTASAQVRWNWCLTDSR